MFLRSLPSILITALLATMPFVLVSMQNKRVALYDLAFALPYLLLILVGFLAEKLNQRRVLCSALAIAVGCAYLCFDAPSFFGAPYLRGPKGQILSIALPLMLFICFALKESALRGWRGAICVAALFLPLAAAHSFYKIEPLGWIFQGRLLDGVFFHHLPNVGVFLALLFAGLSQRTEDRYLRVYRYFLAVALVPLYHVFERTGMRFRALPQFQLEVSLSFISAAAVLVYGNFFLYWQKVYLDELTGIPNRRALNERLSTLGRRYSIAMIDIDHFKRFNDLYGHEQGDSVLRFVAKHFARVEKGEVFRYGGEELCIVFSHLKAAEVLHTVETLREELSLKDFFIRNSRKTSPSRKKAPEPPSTEKVYVTVSIGVADVGTAHHRPEDVIALADQALYKAKQAGRNQVVLAA